MSDVLTIGKYRVVGTLGRGGMGVVYKGHDPVIKRDVAIKVIRKAELHPAEAAAILERFRREAQAAGNLLHPNIVAVYEYGEDEQSAFIAMECVAGRSLREHLVAGWRPELKVFPEVLEQLLEGLDYSHSRGVVHRDIKPANILISESGVVKISDFGIARIERAHVTQAGEVMGTPYYMSPEQIRGEPVDERTDIYSAGMIVYEVLTGRRPFEGQLQALMRSVLDEAPRRPSELDPRLPAELDEAILTALAKRPEERFDTVRDFSSALHQAFQIGLGSPAPGLALKGLPADGHSDTIHVRARGGTPVAGNAALLRKAISISKSQSTPPKEQPTADAGLLITSDPNRPRVLFVDDEERILNSLRSIFRNTYEIETASSGDEALGIFRQRPAHVVVSDQRMPGMLGVDVLRHVKALSPTTVRILLTGYSDLASIVGSVNDGEVYRFISKPWNQQDLMSTVAEAITIANALRSSPPLEIGHRDTSLVALVVGDDPLHRAIRELMNGVCQVVSAGTLDDALRVLGESEVAVLIADLESGGDDNTVLFKVLKEEHPETLVVVTTAASDSELIISLINEARIFRFINKPLNLKLLKQHIDAALERYEQFRAAPQLVQMQRPKAAPSVRQSSAGKNILARLRSFGGRLALALRR